MQSSAAPSKKRSQYATRACNGCRRRRCKCDGAHPTCGACIFYSQDCSWSRETDARRPATKQIVEALRTKIQVLEAELSRLQSRSTPANTFAMTSNNPSHPATAWRQSDLTAAHPLDSFASSSQDTITSSPVSPFSFSTSSQVGLPYADPPSTTVISSYLSHPTYQYIFNIDGSIPVGQLSEGARQSINCHWDRYIPPLSDVGLSRHEHDVLLYRFFSYQSAWLLPIIPDLFLQDLLSSTSSSALQSAPLQHYSPFLHCSLLAFAITFSDNPSVNSKATRDRLLARAKVLMDQEMKFPVLCLAQGFALFAEYYSGIGERDVGYMYLGMSIRVSQAIGLFDESRLGASQGSLQSVIHGWNSWSIFAQGVFQYETAIARAHSNTTEATDKLMALEYGVSYDITAPPAGTSLPAIDAGLDNRPFESQPVHPPNEPQPCRTTLAFRETCKLFVIGARITDQIYYSGAPEESVAINMHLQLDTWFNNLPAELLASVRSNSHPALPHVLVINIHYWWMLMHLHRPFYQRSQALAQSGEEAYPFMDLSNKMCDRAANKILRLVEIFEESHGLRYFPRNMIQAIFACGSTLHMQCAVTAEAAVKKRSTAQAGVNSCVRALRKISSTWPFAEKLAEKLEEPLSGIPPIGFSSVPQPESWDNLPEQSINDQDISNMFYQFVHEWNPTQPHSPYAGSSGYSQESSPMLSSAYLQMGELPNDQIAQGSRDQTHQPTSPLSQQEMFNILNTRTDYQGHEQRDE